MGALRSLQKRRRIHGLATASEPAHSWNLAFFGPRYRLVKCPFCRTLMLRTDPRCPNCQIESAAAAKEERCLRFGAWVVSRIVAPIAILAAIIALAYAANVWIENRRQRQEETQRALRVGAFP